MQEAIMSCSDKNHKNKQEQFKKKKRKFSSAFENDLNSSFGASSVLKKALISNELPEYPRFLQYKNTADYMKVIADPGLLPNTPKIFQVHAPKNDKLNTSDSFFLNLLTSNSFNASESERFCQKTYNNEKCKKKNEKNQKNKKEKEEKTGVEIINGCVNSSKKKDNKQKRKEVVEKEMELHQDDSYNHENSMKKENENLINKVDIYRVPEKETLIFHMHHPSEFSFQGEFRITIIAGEVEVLGYTLSCSSNKDSIDVYSPNFSASLTIQTKPIMQNKPVEEILAKLKDNLTESDYSKCSQNIKPEDSIIFVEQIKSIFGIVINKYFDVPIFTKDFEDVFLMTKTLKKLQSIFKFNLSKNKKYLKKNSQWDKIPLGHCVTLCGGKGVGKSTLLKYYINKCISSGEKVLCLDFDPGQPEFNFPGCVSAVIVDQPVVGPNFTHIIDPVLLMTYGDVNVCHNPSKYLECVKYIIDYCKENEDLHKMKWFVNTMGFCKGLGVSLMISILKLLKPDTVIQIKSFDHKNNYPFYLASVTLNSKSGFSSMPLTDVCLSYDLRVIPSYAEWGKKQSNGSLKSSELRDLMAISYFSRTVSPPFYNFNAIQPYLISFSELYLGIDFFIDPNDVLKAFNGNLVSLTNFKPDDELILSVESEKDDYFKVVIKPGVAPTLGIGFVRGIDCQQKKFYILTHLPLEILDKVNCLTLGRVNTPHSMFLKQDAMEGPIVYTTPGRVDVMQRVKRMFRVIGTSQYRDNSYTEM